ncbi:MAG: hypothetical protein R3268_15015 [Acidiferrobacterales bacterium]|nr:hypothetical protein [Acidiferrobacterales bacterium]
MRARWSIALVMILCTWTTAGHPGERVRSEFFPQRHLALQGQWANPRFTADLDADSRIVAAYNDIELRLFIPPAFTSPPQQAQIFMLIPAQIPGLDVGGGLEVSWVTRGRLLNVTARPGDRVLIFEGVVGEPVLADFLNLVIMIDARGMVGAVRFDPLFEIERR